MKEFMMLFRHVPNPAYQPSPAELEESIAQWQNWIGNIAAQGKFISTKQLGYEGKTLNAAGVVTDGPYAEIKEIIGGNIVVKSENIDEALELAKGCPILTIGGTVEVRDLMQLDF